MLFLLFHVGQERFAIEANHVVEVVPLLGLQRIPQSPPGVAGIFNYRGSPVPAIDVCELASGKRAAELLSTRIIVVQFHRADGTKRLLGIVAERATEMLTREPGDFVETGIKIDAAPYTGPVLLDSKGAIQWVNHQRLLPEPVQQLLFANASA